MNIKILIKITEISHSFFIFILKNLSMSLTPSNMLPIDTIIPTFELINTINDKPFNIAENKGVNGTVVMFICNHCPFVIHINKMLVTIATNYQNKGVNFIAISSNDPVSYPEDGPENMKYHAKINHYPFPYLFDKTQTVAKAFDAACTPDIFIFNNLSKLIYRGQLDDSRPDNGIPVTGSDVIHALECLLKKDNNTRKQKPSIGCNIKWK